MKFHICNIEPQGFPFGHFLDDFCRLVCYTLESLGHPCSMGCNQLEPDRINVIFGGNTLSRPEDVETIAASCRYIAVQHEILNTQGLNLTQDTTQFRHTYLPFLQRAMMVWEGIPRNLEPLRTLGIRCAFFRGGYHPHLEEIKSKRERDIDFLFYGSITPYRRQMIERLRGRGHVVVAVFDPRASYRNDLIGRAKVNLAPVQGPAMQHFASGRVCYLLNNRSLVVVERCEDQEWLQHCFVSATSENWVDICEQTLERHDRDHIRQEFADRFCLLPFSDQVDHLLDQTFCRDRTGTDADSPPRAVNAVAADSTGLVTDRSPSFGVEGSN